MAMAPVTEAKIQALEEDLNLFQASVKGSHAHTFADDVCTSAADVERFLGASLSLTKIGFFMDLCASLCLAQDQFADGKACADKSKSSTAIDSANVEVDVMATMSHPAPLSLFAKGGGKTALMIPEDGFGHRLKDFATHSGRQVNLFRQDIQKKVGHILSSVRGSVEGQGLAAELARHLLIKVCNQLSELLGFLSDWHEELVQQCDYPSNVAWQFIGFTVRCIMDCLVSPRMEVASVTCLSSSTKPKAAVIWAVLQVHIGLDDIVCMKFKSHHLCDCSHVQLRDENSCGWVSGGFSRDEGGGRCQSSHLVREEGKCHRGRSKDRETNSW